jgi:hypothetical protein
MEGAKDFVTTVQKGFTMKRLNIIKDYMAPFNV